MPFRRVAADSYSGASRLQWPHLMDRGYGSVSYNELYFSCTEDSAEEDLAIRFQCGIGNLGGNQIGFVQRKSLLVQSIQKNKKTQQSHNL